MSPRIYTSSIPAVPIRAQSTFTHVLSAVSSSPYASTTPGHVGGFPGSAPAFIDAASGATLTRAHLKQLALAFAHGILHHPNLVVPPKKIGNGSATATTTQPPPTPLVRGDTVMIFSANSLMWPVLLHGSVAAGLRATLANSSYTARELAWQWIDSGARIVCASEELVGVVRDMFRLVGVPADEAERRLVVVGRGLGWVNGVIDNRDPGSVPAQWEELLTMGSLGEEERFDGRYADETAYLCYSSGTTGKPKGVETTHRNVTAVLDMMVPVFPHQEPGKDVMLGIPPYFHIYGAVLLLHFPLYIGIPLVVQTRFEPVAFCANIERYKVTTLLVVPPVLVVMSRHEAVEKYDLSSLKICLSGAAPLGGALAKQVTARLLALRKGKNPRFVITQGYGLTETSPTTHLVPEEAADQVGSVGILLPNTEARIIDDEEGKVDAEPGEPGELWIRGPNVMKGYLNNDVATRHSITPDGWFKTGDVAVIDSNGLYWIVDRRKELIKYKGFQVPPAELESLLLTHPDIADVAVIGVDDHAEGTELPRAYVVHASPARVKTEVEKAAFGKHVCKWTESKVAKHKFLRGGVVIIDAIPKSQSGKILRRELRDQAKKELTAKL